MGAKKSKPQNQVPSTNTSTINIKPPASKTSKIIGIIIAVVIVIIAIVGVFFIRRILVGDKPKIELSDRVLYTYQGTIQVPGVINTAGAINDTMSLYFYTLDSGLMTLATNDGFYSIVPFTLKKSNGMMTLTLGNYNSLNYAKKIDISTQPDNANLMYDYTFNVYPTEYPSNDLQYYVLEAVQVDEAFFAGYQNFGIDNYILLEQVIQ
jgi:hypothetical protein